MSLQYFQRVLREPGGNKLLIFLIVTMVTEWRVCLQLSQLATKFIKT